MNLRQLHIFKTVCEELNFTEAAKKLYMTQPAISHVIRDLEEEIGSALFDRLSRKIYITEVGKEFLRKTTRILELYDELQNDFYGSEELLPLNIGSSITIANFWLPSFLNLLQAEFKNIPIKIVVDRAKAIEDKLWANEIDIALIEGTIQNKKLLRIPFSSYNMVVFCSVEHPLSIKSEISIENLIKENLLLREKGSAIRDTFDSALFMHNLSVEPYMVSVNSQALIQGVKHNLGVSILPDILIKEELKNKTLHTLKIKDINLSNKNYLVYHQDKYLTKPLERLIEIINEYSK